VSVHILPVNDIRLHSEVGIYCHCNPRVENTDGEVVVIHNAFDGREMFEDSADLSEGCAPS